MKGTPYWQLTAETPGVAIHPRNLPSLWRRVNREEAGLPFHQWREIGYRLEFISDHVRENMATILQKPRGKDDAADDFKESIYLDRRVRQRGRP